MKGIKTLALLLPIFLIGGSIPAYGIFSQKEKPYYTQVALIRGFVKDLEKNENYITFKAIAVRAFILDRYGNSKWTKKGSSYFGTQVTLYLSSSGPINAKFYGILRPHFVFGLYILRINLNSVPPIVPEISIAINQNKLIVTHASSNTSWSDILIKADRDNVVVSFNNGTHYLIGTVPIPMSDIGATGYVTAGDTITVHEPLDENITITLIYEPTGDTIAEFRVHT